ncbi:MAG: hypothetical protein RBS56_01015 [Candidatus Gracilibacteria bacterium]|nr:hypothetical protein [Candidatus Gracilibacteria bacterium]
MENNINKNRAFSPETIRSSGVKCGKKLSMDMPKIFSIVGKIGFLTPAHVQPFLEKMYIKDKKAGIVKKT